MSGIQLPDGLVERAGGRIVLLVLDGLGGLPGPDGHCFRLCVGGTYLQCRGIDIQCPTKAVIQKDGSPKAIIEGYAARIEIDENDFAKII